jgi:hypothetical protein
MPGLDNTNPEMDQDLDAEMPSDMGSDPADVGAEGGAGDQEGAMAKQELIKLANYATNLQEHIEDDEQLEAWVQSKITIAATNIASVYHYLAYEKKIGEYGEALNSAPMSESKRRAIKGWLMEAKAKVKELKKIDAEKKKVMEGPLSGGERACTECGGTGMVYEEPKQVPDHVKGKVEKYKRLVNATKAAHKRMDNNHNGIPDDEEVDESFGTDDQKEMKTGDTKKTRTGIMTKTSTGVVHKNTSYADDGEADDKSGKGKKSHAKAKDSETKKSERGNDIKLPKHPGGTYGMKNGEKFDNRKKDESVYEAKKKPVKESRCNECGMMESKCCCDHSVKEAAEKTMSRAAKGMMKYGKDGMKALAKAGKEGKDLDAVRDKYDKYDESAKWRDPKHKDKLYTQEPRDPHDDYHDADYYNPKPDDYPGAKHVIGGGEFDHNDPLRKGYGRHGTGSMNTHGKRKGMPSRDHISSLKGSIKSAHGKHPQPNLPEGAKPSAGLSAAKKSAVVKDAKAGKDIGKTGKSFDKVAKSAGGGEKGQKIAAAAMWKNIKETTAYLEEKKAAEKKADKDYDGDGKVESGKDEYLGSRIAAAKKAGKLKECGPDCTCPKCKSVNESADVARLRELTGRLNRAETPALVENREVDQIRALTKRLLG